MSATPTDFAYDAVPRYPPRLPGATEFVYAADRGLRLWTYPSPASEPGEDSPAAVFFFGGGWRVGSPEHLSSQARYLASRGLVSVLVDYRVESRDGSTILDSIDDAAEAMQWIHDHLEELGIDGDRVAVVGGSSGGHLAACLALLGGASPHTLSPAALALFNPVLTLAPVQVGLDRRVELDRLLEAAIVERVRGWVADPESVSPYHLLGPALPPTLILHGRDDEVVPFLAVELFAEKAASVGADVTVVGYDGVGHGFYNLSSGGAWGFVATLRRIDEFLASLGWISGEPTIAANPSWPGGDRPS